VPVVLRCALNVANLTVLPATGAGVQGAMGGKRLFHPKSGLLQGNMTPVRASLTPSPHSLLLKSKNGEKEIFSPPPLAIFLKQQFPYRLSQFAIKPTLVIVLPLHCPDDP